MLQSQNADIPGGRIDQGPQSITMRTRGRVEKPETSAISSSARWTATR